MLDAVTEIAMAHHRFKLGATGIRVPAAPRVWRAKPLHPIEQEISQYWTLLREPFMPGEDRDVTPAAPSPVKRRAKKPRRERPSMPTPKAPPRGRVLLEYDLRFSEHVLITAPPEAEWFRHERPRECETFRGASKCTCGKYRIEWRS